METVRCNLRALQSTDRDNIFKLYQDEGVRRFLGGTVADKNMFDNRFDGILKDVVARNWVVLLKPADEFIGLITIDRHHDGDDYEISYQFLPQFWGQGLAYESLECIFTYAAFEMKLQKIVAETQKANAPSCRLLEKLGMAPIRTLIRFNEEQALYQKNLSLTME